LEGGLLAPNEERNAFVKNVNATVELSADAFEQDGANDEGGEVCVDSNFVPADEVEHLSQKYANVDVREFVDTELSEELVHFLSEQNAVFRRDFGLSGMFHHEVSAIATVTLDDAFKEAFEIEPINVSELADEANIEHHELHLTCFGVFADHQVSRVHISVDEIMDKKHGKVGTETDVGEALTFFDVVIRRF